MQWVRSGLLFTPKKRTMYDAFFGVIGKDLVFNFNTHRTSGAGNDLDGAINVDSV